MATCELTQRMIALHDGEVGAEERGRLQEHVLHCPECAAELERLRAISRLMASADVPVLSPAGLRRLHDAVDAASEKAIFRMAGEFAAAAAALLIISVAWLLAAGEAGTARARADSEWERAAVMQPAEPAGGLTQELQVAQWIVENLSTENDRD